MGAVLIPDGTIALHGNIVHRASVHTGSASGAGVQRIERIHFHKETIESGIYKATFHSICQSNSLLRERLVLANGICAALQYRDGPLDNRESLFPLGGIKHGNVILRHNNAQDAAIV